VRCTTPVRGSVPKCLEPGDPNVRVIYVEHRVPHRLTSGPERYTSLAASADGRRLVLTLATPNRTLWRLRLADSPIEMSAPTRIPVTTSTGFSPRLGPDYLFYVSATGAGESIWKVAGETATELWNAQGGRIFGGPAISRDGRSVAFSVRQNGRALLYAMQADGTNARIVTDSLDLQGSPAWAGDGQSITSAANDHGVPHLFRVPVGGGAPELVDLKTGAERQLTNLAPDFDIRDFDISPDGREVVLERVQGHSDVVMLDLPQQ
jgi:dipeptidyl aminopeptidase/acylaminoacyl peptidase